MSYKCVALMLAVACSCSFALQADFTNGTYKGAAISLAPGEQFTQYGGDITLSAGIGLTGGWGRQQAPMPASYNLKGGNLSCGNINVYFGTFSQTAGTNIVTNSLTCRTSMEPSRYILGGGTLITSNIILEGSYRGGISQTGGVHRINGLLTMSGSPTFRLLYTLDAGELHARDIFLIGQALFRHTGGTFSQDGLLTLAGSHWEAGPGENNLGTLQLSTGYDAFASTFTMPAGPSLVRFRDSHNISWNPQCILWIRNWTGSTNGGGAQQIVFGNNVAGLTSGQIGQIRFLDPVSLPFGEYAATMLPTGELVPLANPAPRGPQLFVHRRAGAVVVEWPEGYILQSTTNVLEPFTDYYPYNTGLATVPISGSPPMRLFRLRR